MLFPFTYKNGVLDIALMDGVDTFLNGTPPLSPPLSSFQNGNVDNNYLFKLLGGKGLVTSLGPNFLRYITGWRNLDQNSSIAILKPGIMTKVQASPKQIANSGYAYTDSPHPPSSDQDIAGDSSNMYRTTWIFKQPLTIAVTENGIVSYVTFYTTLY